MNTKETGGNLVAPPTGTHNVVITFSADLLRYAAAGVITFTGVNQTTPLGSFAGNNATSNAARVTVPSSNGDLALGVLGCETCTSVTFTAPAIQRWNHIAGGGNEIGAGATNTGSSPSTTISAALGSSDHWAMGGVAIKHVGGSGSSSGGKVLAAYHATPQKQVSSRPRQAGKARLLLTLSRDPGVVWRSYYYAGSARIAMREDSDQGSQVYYILTDHLGSTSLTYRASDGQVDRQWYSPWGSVRQVVGQLPTDRTFQGQRDPGWGLAQFGARRFDNHLGRFAQADTIIPGAGFSIAWDRYAGLFNNPLKYVDLSGHKPCIDNDENGQCIVDLDWKRQEDSCSNWEICLLAAVIMSESNRGTYPEDWMEMIAWTYLNRTSLIPQQNTLWKAVKGNQSAAHCYYRGGDDCDYKLAQYPGLSDNPTTEELSVYWSNVYKQGSQGKYAVGWKKSYEVAKESYLKWSVYGTGSTADPTSRYIEGGATDFRMVQPSNANNFWAGWGPPGRPNFKYANLGLRFIPGLGESRHMFISNLEYSNILDVDSTK